MILEAGNKVLVVHRRLFDTDQGRLFIGVVDGYENGLAKITGTTWLRDQYLGTFVEKEDPRTKILSITSGTLIFYQLPSNTKLDSVQFTTDQHGGTYLTDGGELKMDLTERLELTKPGHL